MIAYSQVKIQNSEKNHVEITKQKCPLRREITTFPSVSIPIGRFTSIFRRKLDVPNPSEVDIKVLFPLPTIFTNNKQLYKSSITGKYE